MGGLHIYNIEKPKSNRCDENMTLVKQRVP